MQSQHRGTPIARQHGWPLRPPSTPVALGVRPLPRSTTAISLQAELKTIDDKLSWRPLQLDPAGYFIIRVDREAREIVADHYSNAINEQGLAVDDETGEVIGCRGGSVRLPRQTFRGRTAKEISVRILEEHLARDSDCVADAEGQEVAAAAGQGRGQDGPQVLPWISRLEHANYLGREFVRAEFALLTGSEYVQD